MSPARGTTVTQPQIFEPNGRAIAYLDEGEGPALILIPAQGRPMAELDVLVHIIADEGFRVVRIGYRDQPAGADATMHDLGDDVIDVMDHLSIAHAWIGGHGFGGAVARTVALDHPDHADGVLLMSVQASASVEDPAVAATPEHEWASLASGMPVLLVHGTDDLVSPLATAEQLQASASDRATLVRIEGAGHDFPATHPGEAAFAIAEYLDWD